MLTVKPKAGKFLPTMKAALEFIDKHPRIILLMAWPVFTLLVIGLVLIIWKGGWLVMPAIQLKQLDILGGGLIGLLTILGLNQLAQSSNFFSKLGIRIGSFLDMSADMDEDGQPGNRGRRSGRHDRFDDGGRDHRGYPPYRSDDRDDPLGRADRFDDRADGPYR